MIPTFTLLIAALAGPGLDGTAATAADVRRPVADSPYANLREAREAVKAALRDSSHAGGREAAETVPGVLSAYRRIGASERLPARERRRLEAQLQTRLSELQSTLRRREQRALASGSGGVVANAQDLIELIQTTIAPETWEINGGKGSIFYYPWP